MPKARGESCGKMRSHSSLEDTQAVGGFCALLIYQVSADTLISSGIRDRRWGSQRTTSYRLQPCSPKPCAVQMGTMPTPLRPLSRLFQTQLLSLNGRRCVGASCQRLISAHTSEKMAKRLLSPLTVNAVGEGTSPSLSSACFSTRQAGMAAGLSSHLSLRRAHASQDSHSQEAFAPVTPPWPPETGSMQTVPAERGIALNEHQTEGDASCTLAPHLVTLLLPAVKGDGKIPGLSKCDLWVATGGIGSHSDLLFLFVIMSEYFYGISHLLMST